MSSPRLCSLRLCRLHKWPTYRGYGFQLNEKNGRPGEYIGEVEEESPAEAAGLRKGDRIIEVNEFRISYKSHQNVAAMIMVKKEEVDLLVIDHEGDQYFQLNDLKIHGKLPGIVKLETPPTAADWAECKRCAEPKTFYSDSSETSAEYLEPLDAIDTLQDNSLKLNMTAKEMRELLAAKKKYDPKNDPLVSMQTKYETFKQL